MATRWWGNTSGTESSRKKARRLTGESLEGVVMLGVVTHEVLSVYEADWMPV
ncbi:hypothetical protein QMZ93_12185 [Pantoea stewartii subsp. indologenes]|uniref:hypothetical protein n=1 Tax=Pantoea stewartii TaxID=66269 RepID=UPI001CF76EA2|nr:hypothetical protein [Pantoea stewartii]MDK2634094.1 hypothetical protein [Pantoea stewartii subsp. indologenes]